MVNHLRHELSKNVCSFDNIFPGILTSIFTCRHICCISYSYNAFQFHIGRKRKYIISSISAMPGALVNILV